MKKCAGLVDLRKIKPSITNPSTVIIVNFTQKGNTYL